MSGNVRTLSSFNVLIPMLKNCQKILIKILIPTWGIPPEDMQICWICLHFVLDMKYVCTHEIGLEYVCTPGNQSVCTVPLQGKEDTISLISCLISLCFICHLYYFYELIVDFALSFSIILEQMLTFIIRTVDVTR